MKRTQHRTLNRKRRKIIAIVVGAAIVLGLVGYWATGTPAWSLFQLYRAYKAHDVRAALKYVDVRAVLENAAERLRTELGADAASGTGVASPETVDEFVEAIKPLLQERIRNRLLDSVAGSDFERLSTLAELERGGDTLGDQVGGRLFSIDRDGSEAVLSLRSGARIGLKQTPGRYWRIVSVEGLIKLTPEERELLKSAVLQSELRERILDRVSF